METTNVRLDFSKLNGLVPVVLQHADTKEVLMVGFVDEAAWEQTLRSGVVTLFRRTLGRLQVKGEGRMKAIFSSPAPSRRSCGEMTRLDHSLWLAVSNNWR